MDFGTTAHDVFYGFAILNNVVFFIFKPTFYNWLIINWIEKLLVNLLKPSFFVLKVMVVNRQ